jgi:hypothetical protein
MRKSKKTFTSTEWQTKLKRHHTTSLKTTRHSSTQQKNVVSPYHKTRKKFFRSRKNKKQLICNWRANIPIFASSLLRVSYYLLCSFNLQTKIFSSQTSTRSHLLTTKPWQFLFIFKSFSPDILTSSHSLVLPLKHPFFMIKSLHLEISFYFFLTGAEQHIFCTN